MLENIKEFCFSFKKNPYFCKMFYGFLKLKER